MAWRDSVLSAVSRGSSPLLSSCVRLTAYDVGTCGSPPRDKRAAAPRSRAAMTHSQINSESSEERDQLTDLCPCPAVVLCPVVCGGTRPRAASHAASRQSDRIMSQDGMRRHEPCMNLAGGDQIREEGREMCVPGLEPRRSAPRRATLLYATTTTPRAHRVAAWHVSHV